MQRCSGSLTPTVLLTASHVIDTEFDAVGYGTIWIAVGGLALVVFAITLRWLARRTHRYINVPIAVEPGSS